jgi:A-factor type gamma-butyrolactone 1'-reductase (1S-forming)
MSRRFEGKVALVTGAGSGIGREAAMAFAREGAKVIVADLDHENAGLTAEAIAAEGGIAEGVRCDVGEEDDVRDLFAGVVRGFGHIDFAVNNAGVSHSPESTAALALATWERTLRINVIGAWLCMREELNLMAARRTGVIVNTVSFAGYHTLKNMSAYVASKHALIGLTKNAAIEYAGQGIRINSVCPGAVPTTMFNNNIKRLDAAARADVVQAVADFHPMKRLAEIREIADGILFLCSEQASFITGAMLPIDGAWGAI